MAEIPTLGEFTNMTVDPERGTGQPAVVYDDRQLSHQLNQSAQFNAENQWRKYTFFLGNLKDMYKDVNEIAKQPIMEEDVPQLRSDMGDIIKEIGQNPQGFFGGGPKYNEIQGKIAQLQSKATESRGNQLFNAAHREAILRNPEWNSEDNKALIEGFRKQPLGSRQLYQFDLPGMYDPNALATKLNAAVKSETAFSQSVGNGRWIQKGRNIVYDRPKYDQLSDQAYYQNDERGVPLAKTAQKRFDKLPSDFKSQFKDAKDWFVWDLKNRMLNDSEQKDDLVPDPGYLEAEKLAEKTANDRGELAVKWANHGLDAEKLKKAKTEDLSGADAALNEAVSMIKRGEVLSSANTEVGRSVNPELKNEFQVSDPETLQTFGKLNKDGTTYDVPNRVTYNKKTNDLTLYFDEHPDPKKPDKTVPGERRPLNERQWVSLIVKRKFPNKDIGGINTLVEDVLKKNGSIYNLSKKLDDSGNYLKTYKFNGKDVSEKDVNEAAAAWGITPEEYRKKFKIE